MYVNRSGFYTSQQTVCVHGLSVMPNIYSLDTDDSQTINKSGRGTPRDRGGVEDSDTDLLSCAQLDISATGDGQCMYFQKQFVIS